MTQRRPRRIRPRRSLGALAVAASLAGLLALAGDPALAVVVAVAAVTGAAAVMHWRCRRPSPDADRERPAPEDLPGPETTTDRPGDGRYSYEHTLGELLRLVGRPVRVLVMDANGMPAARLCGRFHGATNLSEPGEPELLLFAVGDNCWLVLGRDEFAGAAPVDNPEQLGLSMRLGALTVSVLDEQASLDREALASEQRAEP